jgi:hypothetical protein
MAATVEGTVRGPATAYPARVALLANCGISPLAVKLTFWHGCFRTHMRKHLINCRRRHVLTSFLLAMLLFRAYIPVGFMPASGTPFLLELCPAASPMPMPAHHHHSDSHTHFENCPFGSAPGAGPISHLVAFRSAPPLASHAFIPFEPLRLGVRLERAHQPRGPPILI